MKINFKQIVLSICVWLVVQGGFAQVTIGMDGDPVSGAILQLKQSDATSGNDENSEKGLGLPRVIINNQTPANPAALAASIGNNSGNYDLEEHVGLVVYNIQEPVFNVETCQYEGVPIGVYVWTGEKWEPINERPTEVRNIADDGQYVTIKYKEETTRYRYSSFGDAGTWMVENLATTYRPDGVKINKNPDWSQDIPRYFVPGGNPAPLGKEGLLYNWPATMNRAICAGVDQRQQVPHDVDPYPGTNEVEYLSGTIQGICPKGWHVPSDREWNELEMEITNNFSKYSSLADGKWDSNWEIIYDWRGSQSTPQMGIGQALKSSTTFVNGINPYGASKPAADGGFDVLMVGFASGSAQNYGKSAYFWSASRGADRGNAVRRNFENVESNKWSERQQVDTATLQSVRCKKDD